MIFRDNTFIEYKIHDFLASGTMKPHPMSIDYKKDVTTRFAQKFTFNKYGFLTNVTYYESETETIDPTTLIKTIEYHNEILTVEFTYEVGTDGFVSHRDRTTAWKTTDDDYIALGTHIKTKYYNVRQAQREGIKRRQNVIDDLKTKIAGLILFTEESVTNVPEAENMGRPLMLELEDYINNYKEANDPDALNTAINASTESFLDNVSPNPLHGGMTIRQIAVFTINDARI